MDNRKYWLCEGYALEEKGTIQKIFPVWFGLVVLVENESVFELLFQFHHCSSKSDILWV